MLHPIGDLAPSVYWRRRIVLLAVLILAIVSVAVVVTNGAGGGNGVPSAGSETSTGANTGASTTPTPTAPATTSAAASTPVSSPATPPTPTRTSTAPVIPKACTAAALSIGAATNAKTYAIGAQPRLSLLVTNIGAVPCIEDLADPKIELRVFSGSARIWGSHDCLIQPGTSLQTLPVKKVIRRDIAWSGLSSQPGCVGVRQRVPAGTYQLTALLAGAPSKPATFAFTG
ncbi:MAG: hypothetical protein JWN95_2023 [Frankiales bacterium]|nr:hypothetical protein [Frankiales bacterium]